MATLSHNIPFLRVLICAWHDAIGRQPIRNLFELTCRLGLSSRPLLLDDYASESETFRDSLVGSVRRKISELLMVCLGASSYNAIV
jgi:hypothetical protein